MRPQEVNPSYDAFLERIHPDDRAAVDAAYTGSLLKNLDGYEIEHRLVLHSEALSESIGTEKKQLAEKIVQI